jgi:ABC-type amino acid transport substrate-binding protein
MPGAATVRSRLRPRLRPKRPKRTAAPAPVPAPVPAPAPVPLSHRIHLSRVLPHQAADLQLFAKGNVRLRVAVYANFYPVAYRHAATGRVSGFDVDIIEGFCKATGLTPVFVPVKNFFDVWESPGAWNDRFDAAIGGIGRTTYRVTHGVEWSVPYFRVLRTVVYNRAAPILRFPEDVTGKIVGTMGSTGMNDAALRMYRAGKGDLLEFRDGSDAKDLRDLLAGKVQGVMRGSFVGRALVARHPRRLAMTEPWHIDPSVVGSGGEVFAIPCRRGSGLAGMLSAYLMQLSANGGLARLVHKYKMDG